MCTQHFAGGETILKSFAVDTRTANCCAIDFSTDLYFASQNRSGLTKNIQPPQKRGLYVWYARLGSNQRPSESESDALSNCATGAYLICNDRMAVWYHSISFGGLTANFSSPQGRKNQRQERGAPLYEKTGRQATVFLRYGRICNL